MEGRATIAGREVVHPAVPAEDMMQAFEYRHLVPTEELKVAVGGKPVGRGILRILGKTPIKIPAGGTASVQIDAPPRVFSERLRLVVTEPAEGISVKTVSPSPQGTEIVLESDAAKMKPGQKGNLIVVASAKGVAAPGKGKPKSPLRAVPVATLPAIPFEIIPGR
jgi:hypothetical protein